MANLVITKLTGNNRIDAAECNDLITTGAGNDTIYAGDGNNTVKAGAGDNWVETGNGRDTIYSLAGNDTIVAGDGQKYIDAGAGNNSIRTGTGNNTIIAGAGNDVIEVGNGANNINAGAGNNRINSGIGNDTIVTGAGNDTIVALGGNNRITTGNGNDIVVTGAGNDTITACDGNATISAGDGNNCVTFGNGNHLVKTGSGNDTIYGGGRLGEKNTIETGTGNDYLVLGAADDTIILGRGNNTLYAGGGNHRAVLTFGENVGYKNYLCGGTGNCTDTLVLRFTTEELSRADVKADLARYQQHLASGKAASAFQFTSLDLKVVNWEKLEIELINTPPTLPKPGEQSFSTNEDTSLQFNLLKLVTDVDGDKLTLAGASGAAHGSLSFNADGTVNYVPSLNWSGVETISYTVDDGHGGKVTGTATITVVAIADTPTVDLHADGWKLNLTGALTDTDGSESLHVTLAGVPTGILLDKGVYDAATGIWTLQAADLGELNLRAPAGMELGNDTVLKATAYAVESSNGDTATASYTLYSPDDNVIHLNALPTEKNIIDGGGGFDTLVFDGMKDIDLSGLAHGAVRNIESIDLDRVSDVKLTLSAKQVGEITSDGHLYVDGDAHDRVTLTDRAGWVNEGVATEFGNTYNVFDSGDAYLYLQQGIALM